ncbi:MAG: Gfo/Idh/MocA family oxidoreductase [Opitutae bacterium]
MSSLNRKIRMGMVGGGRGAFIGAVHRMAAALDGQIELVAGSFSADPEKSRLSGQDLYLNPKRVYGSYQEMASAEAKLPVGERIDFVSIVARNDMHYPVAKAFLEAGIHVVCEKPLAYSLAEAKKLLALTKKKKLIFALTHNYTGYPMVKEARAMVAAGKLGKINKIVVEYPQGYASPSLQAAKPSKISNWRMNPNVSGISNCIGDIGTHAQNLAQYITGLEVKEVAAELTAFIPGHTLDDDGNMLVRYKNGARGVLYASQISTGEENNLNIRVYGSLASLEWHQEDPNELMVKFVDAPRQVWRRGNSYNGPQAKKYTRTPFGHPEGFIEAFGNIYCAVVEAITDRLLNRKAPKEGYDFPTIDNGVTGMAFVEAAVKSSKANARWTKLKI